MTLELIDIAAERTGGNWVKHVPYTSEKQSGLGGKTKANCNAFNKTTFYLPQKNYSWVKNKYTSYLVYHEDLEYLGFFQL